MKTKLSGRAAILPGLFLLALLMAGCAGPKIDWGSRVGLYTYDQAVLELGPPDKSARLTDGTLVAEWLISRGRSGGYHHPPPSYYYARPYPYWHETSSPDFFLRLTFSPEGTLSAWRRYSRY